MQLSVIQCDCCQVTVAADDAQGWSKFVSGWSEAGDAPTMRIVTEHPNGSGQTPAWIDLPALQEVDVCPVCRKAMETAIERVRSPRSPFVMTPEDAAQETIAAVEQRHILATLKRCRWNKSRAAQILGIERSTLDRKLKLYKATRPTPSEECPVHVTPENVDVPSSHAFCTCAPSHA